jgi:hypothetical protein
LSYSDVNSTVLILLLLPVLYGAVGAWLSEVGTSDGWCDDFYSAWPFACIGTLVAVVGWVNLAG